MKIYFSVSISRMDEATRKNCRAMVTHLKKQGHKILSEEILDKQPDNIQKQSTEQAIAEQKRLTKLKKYADLVIVEATNPSFGVGQEIALSLSLNKPVIALYREGTKPHILRDEGGDLLVLESYTDDTLIEILEDAIDYASNYQDVRFNFFISPSIGNYLDWISKEKKIPRSVYLRNLIERDMDENKEYND